MVTQKLRTQATNGNINHDETAASAELQNQIRRTWHDSPDFFFHSFVRPCLLFFFSLCSSIAAVIVVAGSFFFIYFLFPEMEHIRIHSLRLCRDTQH